MIALMIKWIPKPTTAESEPIIDAIIESMPIIPIKAPKTRPPIRLPTMPCRMLLAVIVHSFKRASSGAAHRPPVPAGQ
jgi:hypothetical protein